MADKALNGAIAVTRFGMGARPGDIDDASHDPVGWLEAQIRREGADQPVSSPLPATPPPAPKPTQAVPGVAMATGPVPEGAMAASTGQMAMAAPPAPPAPVPPRTDFGVGQPLPTDRKSVV